MFRKAIIIAIGFLGLLLLSQPVRAQEKKPIYFANETSETKSDGLQSKAIYFANETSETKSDGLQSKAIYFANETSETKSDGLQSKAIYFANETSETKSDGLQSKAIYFANETSETKSDGLQSKAIYFFWSKTCPHCAREEVFLNNLVKKYPELEIKDFEVSANQKNLDLLKEVGEKLSARGGVPFTVVGKYHFVGYLDDATTGKEIEEAVSCYLAEGCQDVVAELINGSSQAEGVKKQGFPETIDLPLIGEVKTLNLSLPALTFIIALLDGFNPCAMWALLFLISLLLGMRDRKRMWALGTAFILASGVVYFLFMTAWLNLFLFLGFVLWVRVIIGLIALATGGYSLRDYWVNREGACKVTGNENRRKIFDRLRQITQRKEFWLALGGIVLLAFAVNLIELVCSAGLPAIYTQILTLTDLPRWQYYAYLAFYILIFMLDDLFVFVVAMVTLRATGIQTKYARYSRLIGGVLMLIIGGLLLLKPEWLMFG